MKMAKTSEGTAQERVPQSVLMQFLFTLRHKFTLSVWICVELVDGCVCNLLHSLEEKNNIKSIETLLDSKKEKCQYLCSNHTKTKYR